MSETGLLVLLISVGLVIIIDLLFIICCIIISSSIDDDSEGIDERDN